MAKFAPVVPIAIARELQRAPEDLLGEYHLLLAHDVVSDSQGYQDVYGTVRAKYGRYSFIIMDNSVVELGEAVSIEMLLTACQIVGPDCLVVPDVMNDGQGTRDRVEAFMNDWYKMKRDTGRKVPTLMGVIQGENLDECKKTYLMYRNYVDIGYIAVPRVIAQKHGSRMPILCWLAGMSELKDDIHLLGFSDNLLDDVSCARMRNVRGIDSAVPIRAALKDIYLDGYLSEPEVDICGPRGDFWTQTIPDSGEIRAAIIHNLRVYRRWIDREDGVGGI